MAELKDLPLSGLKIDRTFVLDLRNNSRCRAIVSSTIALAHTLGMKTIAEGVEDAGTFELLKELGCDEAQGYYLHRPTAATDRTPLLRR